MNPAFIILVAIVCIAVWFLMAILYKPIGKFLYRIWKDAADNMTEIDESGDDVK